MARQKQASEGRDVVHIDNPYFDEMSDLNVDPEWRRPSGRALDDMTLRARTDKLAVILARIKTLWAQQVQGRRVSRLDGGTIFTDEQWIALGDTALFDKPGDDEGGGGAPPQTLPARAVEQRQVASNRSHESSRGQR